MIGAISSADLKAISDPDSADLEAISDPDP
jgi:hypothetical protein